MVRKSRGAEMRTTREMDFVVRRRKGRGLFKKGEVFRIELTREKSLPRKGFSGDCSVERGEVRHYS